MRCYLDDPHFASKLRTMCEMGGKPSFAPHERMDERASLAREFWDLTRPELVPFVSDEANWYDFDFMADDELLTLLDSHYAARVTSDELRLPFWKLLDCLNRNRHD